MVSTKNLIAIFVAIGAVFAFAVPGTQAAGDGTDGHSLQPMLLIALVAMLLIAKIAGELATRVGQAAVLGELLGGIILGNLVLFGFTAAEPLKSDAVIAALAELGVILLLFEVGLESNLKEMMEVGWSSLLVAVLGVVAPFILGWVVSAYFIPDEPRLVHIFVGATLCATSVGITARVFKDLGMLSTKEARIILGAAVIDDVLGLIVLAVVAGAIRATSTGATLETVDIVLISAKAVAFLVGSIIVGRFLLPRLLRGAALLKTSGVLLTVALCTCFFLAWVATKVGLAPIVGAFAAGLVLDEVHYQPKDTRKQRNLTELLQPVNSLLVPIFFVLMGLKVDLRTFLRLDVLGFATVLTIVAIVGKQICSLGVLDRKSNRFAIGVGMIPRGEVGLIFAGIGSTLVLTNASGIATPVIGPATFGSIVMMVMITTLVTPPALKWALSRRRSN